MLTPLLLCFVTSSALAAEVCYEPCGCFNDDPPFDDRPLPESPEAQEIVWLLYTQSNPNIGVNIHWDDIPPEYDASKPTKFLIHGFTSDPGQRVTMVDIKDAFLDAGYDYNIITVDWSTGAQGPDYPEAASNTQVVGACSGYLAEVLTNVGNVHCIGHSLGGHTCGYLGKFVNGNLGRISGLDPAGPLFDADHAELRLDPSDADFVDVLHTNCQGAAASGLEDVVGHVDFYPHNCGDQPPCDGPVCDHGVCKDYYLASIEVGPPTCTFESYPCDLMPDGNLVNCGSCGSGCQSMGYHADTYSARGTFYLEVDAAYPHCQN